MDHPSSCYSRASCAFLPPPLSLSVVGASTRPYEGEHVLMSPTRKANRMAAGLFSTCWAPVPVLVSMSAPVPVVGTFWITMRLVGAMSAEPSQHPNGKQEEWQTEGVAQPRTGGREGHGCWPKEPRGEWGSSKKDLGSSEWGHFWKWILQRQWQN